MLCIAFLTIRFDSAARQENNHPTPHAGVSRLCLRLLLPTVPVTAPASLARLQYEFRPDGVNAYIASGLFGCFPVPER